MSCSPNRTPRVHTRPRRAPRTPAPHKSDPSWRALDERTPGARSRLVERRQRRDGGRRRGPLVAAALLLVVATVAVIAWAHDRGDDAYVSTSGVPGPTTC